MASETGFFHNIFLAAHEVEAWAEAVEAVVTSHAVALEVVDTLVEGRALFVEVAD